jgi:hypothetical protein
VYLHSYNSSQFFLPHLLQAPTPPKDSHALFLAHYFPPSQLDLRVLSLMHIYTFSLWALWLLSYLSEQWPHRLPLIHLSACFLHHQVYDEENVIWFHISNTQ